MIDFVYPEIPDDFQDDLVCDTFIDPLDDPDYPVDGEDF